MAKKIYLEQKGNQQKAYPGSGHLVRSHWLNLRIFIQVHSPIAGNRPTWSKKAPNYLANLIFL